MQHLVNLTWVHLVHREIIHQKQNVLEISLKYKYYTIINFQTQISDLWIKVEIMLSAVYWRYHTKPCSQQGTVNSCFLKPYAETHNGNW